MISKFVFTLTSPTVDVAAGTYITSLTNLQGGGGSNSLMVKTLGNKCEFDVYSMIYDGTLYLPTSLDCSNNFLDEFTFYMGNGRNKTTVSFAQDSNRVNVCHFVFNDFCSTINFNDSGYPNDHFKDASGNKITSITYTLPNPLMTTSCSSNTSSYSSSNFTPTFNSTNNKLTFTPQDSSLNSIPSLDTNATRLVSAVNNALTIIGDTTRVITYDSEFYCDGANPLIKIIGMECPIGG